MMIPVVSLRESICRRTGIVHPLSPPPLSPVFKMGGIWIVPTIHAGYLIVCFLQVLLETLRLHPPATGLSKQTPKGGVELSGYRVPQNTLVYVRVKLSVEQCSCTLSIMVSSA